MSTVKHQLGTLPLGMDGRRLGVSGSKIVGGFAWGLALGVIGLWVLVEPVLPGFLNRLTRVERAGFGLGLLAGGQLIFLMFVAERFFPRAPRRLLAGTQWGLAGVGVACVFLVVFSLMTGA